MLSSGTGRTYIGLHSISHARTLISSYEILILTKQRIIATANESMIIVSISSDASKNATCRIEK